MDNELKRVGLKLTAEGARDFKTELKECTAATKENYSELKLAQSQYDKNTSSMDKLADRQKYLQGQTEIYSDKVKILTAQLEEMESAENKDETAIAKKKAELNEAQAKLNTYEKALKDVNTQLKTHSEQLKEWGDKLKDVGDKMSGIGDGLSTHVTAPIVAVAAGATAAWKEVDDAMDTVTEKTGATGEKLEDLEQRVKNIAETIPTDFGTAAEAVGEVNTRFGLTGDALEALSSKFVQFADLNDEDVSNAIDETQKALSAFGLGAEDAEGFLDILNRTGQTTGVDMGTLRNGLVQNGTAFQEMGLSIEQSTVFMGMLEKSGANSETVMNALRKALKNAASEGKPMNVALEELQDTILNGTDNMDGLTAAYELFGKSGDQIFGAVKNGTLDFTDLANQQDILADSMNSVADTYNATLDPMDQMQVTMNTLKDLGAEIVTTAGPMITEALGMIRDLIVSLKEKWDSLSPETQQAIEKAVLIAAAIGPILSVGGRLISGIGSLISIAGVLLPLIAGISAPVLIVIGVIAALIAIGVLLYKNWDTIKEKAGEIRDWVVEKWNALKEGVASAVDTAKQRVIDGWNTMKENVRNAVENIGQNVREKWESIKENVSGAVESIRSNVQEKFNAAKEKASEVWESLKEKTSTAWSNIKSTIEEHGGGITGIIGTAMDGYKSIWENGMKFLDDITGGKLTGIYNWFHDKFEDVKTYLGPVVDWIQGLFNFEWSLPDLKLPHIVVDSYIDIPVIGTIPDPLGLRVEWYKRAYTRAAYYAAPTVRGDGRGFGDGQGGEFAVGESHLRDVIREETGNNELISLVEMIINLLSNREPTNLIINQAPGEDVRDLAREVADLINLDYDREESVFA